MTIECSQSVHSIVFSCPLRDGSPAKQAQGRQCVLANKNCPGTLFPNRTIYLFYRTQHRWAVFSSGSRCCRFQSEKGKSRRYEWGNKTMLLRRIWVVPRYWRICTMVACIRERRSCRQATCARYSSFINNDCQSA